MPAHAVIEILDALQLPERQPLKLRLQLLDALAQLPQPRRARRCRWRGLCACGCPLLREFSRERPGAGQLGIIRAARAGQLLDREVLVVALEHVSLYTREEIAARRCRPLLGGRELAALLSELMLVDQESRLSACTGERGVAPPGGELPG